MQACGKVGEGMEGCKKVREHIKSWSKGVWRRVEAWQDIKKHLGKGRACVKVLGGV